MNIVTKSGHNMCITKISRDEIPSNLEFAENYNEFWKVQNFDTNGRVFFYLAKGNPDAKSQIVGWYVSGEFNSSYEKTLADAVEMMIRDGWLYHFPR